MNRYFSTLIYMVLAALLSSVVSTAQAHHGWAWAEDEQIDMTGVIREVHVGPPHPRLEIRTEDDGDWQVDLGNPTQTEEAGFDEGSASKGDTVVVRGHRSKDADEKLIKAVRITIGDDVYTFYPDRVEDY
ncbi:MAG: DUF6152 family protein [Marinobacter sp.]